MPKIYKYFGIVFIFYSRDHLPIHIHGKKNGCESKAEIIIKNGRIDKIVIKKCGCKPPLERSDKKNFINFVNAYAEEIKKKWIQFFVDGITPEM